MLKEQLAAAEAKMHSQAIDYEQQKTSLETEIERLDQQLKSSRNRLDNQLGSPSFSHLQCCNFIIYDCHTAFSDGYRTGTTDRTHKEDAYGKRE